MLAVLGARRGYRLPYFPARSDLRPSGPGVRFRSRRVASDGPSAELDVEYSPAGPSREPEPGSLEYFLTERYCLYTLDSRGALLRADIHHPPWPLRAATATFHRNTMASPFGIDLSGSPLLHLAERQDVLIWPLTAAKP
jgi:uncharacterized protein